MSPPLVEVGGMEAGIPTVVTYLSVNIHAPNSEPSRETVLKGNIVRLMLKTITLLQCYTNARFTGTVQSTVPDIIKDSRPPFLASMAFHGAPFIHESGF
jgi:hypothetical protein